MSLPNNSCRYVTKYPCSNEERVRLDLSQVLEASVFGNSFGCEDNFTEVNILREEIRVLTKIVVGLAETLPTEIADKLVYSTTSYKYREPDQENTNENLGGPIGEEAL